MSSFIMLRNVFIQSLLVDLSFATVSQTCVWKDGKVADNFIPCENSTSTSGSCCLNGESCLDSGLCYGALGLIYRGACINTWGSSDCPTYCDNFTGQWANLYPCPFGNTGSSLGPESFWCGADGTEMCTGTNTSLILKIAAPGNVKKAETTQSALSTTSPTGSSTSSTGSKPTSSKAAQETDNAGGSGDSNNGVDIGLGVALGVVVLLWAATAFWLFRANRQQKATIAMLSGGPASVPSKDETYGDGRGVYRQPEIYPEVEGHVVGSELDNSVMKPRPAELGS